MVISDLMRRTTILWDDITFSTVSWTIEGIHTASLNWVFRTKGKKDIEVRLGYYSRADMIILANHLIDRSKEAKISEKIYQIAQGKFPWFLI